MKRNPFDSPARCCPACERSLPPEGAECPYCDEPLPSPWVHRLCMACCGGAVALGLITIGMTGSLPILAPPATLAHGLLLAGGTAILFAPFRWQRLVPPTRRDRLAAILRSLGQRFYTVLAIVLLLFVLRQPPCAWLLPVAVAALLVTTGASIFASRDTRTGVLAGVLIGLA